MKHVIACKVTPKRYIRAVIAPKGVIRAKLRIPSIVNADIYTGAYEVTPIFADVNLETAGKTMTRDVTVESIPVRSATNLSGGYTVTIGGDM